MRTFWLIFFVALLPINAASAGWWNMAASSGNGGCAESGFTNLISSSRDLTAWTQSGTSVSAYDAIGLDAIPNTATTLTDNDASGYEYVYVNISKTASTNYTLRIFIKKVAADPETSFAYVLWAGAPRNLSATVNRKTGVITNTVNAWDDTYTIDHGDFFECLFLIDSTHTGTNGALRIYPAGEDTEGSTGDATATGVTIIGNVGFYENKIISDVAETCPVYTP